MKKKTQFTKNKAKTKTKLLSVDHYSLLAASITCLLFGLAFYGETFVPKLKMASVNLQSLVQNYQSLVLIHNCWSHNYKWLA